MYLKALQRPRQVPMRCSNEGVLRQRHKFGGLAPREPDHLLLLLQAPSLSPDSLPPVFPEPPLPLFIPWSLISLRTSPSLPSHFLPLIRLCVSATFSCFLLPLIMRIIYLVIGLTGSVSKADSFFFHTIKGIFLKC